jgi:hypothetical protein
VNSDLPLIRTAPDGARCVGCGHRAHLILIDQPVCVTIEEIQELHDRKARRRELPPDTGADGAR